MSNYSTLTNSWYQSTISDLINDQDYDTAEMLIMEALRFDLSNINK